MSERRLCGCGCGKPTLPATKTRTGQGHLRGRPMAFLRGHRPRRPLAERFAEKVRPATDLSPNGMVGCLLWTAATDGHGYGTILVGDVIRRAHVAAWWLAGRTVPEGHELDHLCRRPACVNVDHLEDVTHANNCQRGATAKLTHEQAREVRYLARAGWRPVDIAAAYSISRSQIHKIKTGEAWANV